MKKSKQFIAAATVATLVTTAIAPFASAATLNDLKNFTYKNEIEYLVNQGVVSGYPDHTFRPYKTLTRSDVVKILGKYMVSLGYQIPSNYKTKMRFTDLSRSTEDELLQYAALVKDYGVFKGSNNRLMPKNNMTNEQAANVLVRAFTVMDDFDYASHVAGQTFFREFLDDEVISSETKLSMDVFDYYDIVVNDYFYPKFSIQRGDFAHMLFGMMQLKTTQSIDKLAVQKIVAVTPTRLTVTLSDYSTHDIYLDEPLVENVATSVSFTIAGEKYNGTATYTAKQLQVTKVENLNSGQFVIHFNQEVDLATTYQTNDLAKFMSLKKVYSTTTSSSYATFQKGELSADRKSFTVTLDSKEALNGSYLLKISGVRALTGKSMADYEESVYFKADTVKPYVTKIENLSKNLVKVTFNEPVYTNYSSISYKLADGKVVTGVTAKYLDDTYDYYKNATEIIFDLTNARQISLLSDYTRVYATISNLRDLAGNVIATNPYTFEMQKGGPDGVAPVLQSITQTGAKQFRMTFNEPMDTIYPYQVLLDSANDYYYIEDITRVEGDTNSFIVTVDQYLDGKVTVRSNDKYLVMDATGTRGTFAKSATFEYNTSKANIDRTYSKREDNIVYLFVQFDRNIVLEDQPTVSLQNASYTYGGTTYSLSKPQTALVYATDEPNVVKIPMKDLVKNYDREGATFNGQLSFTNVYNEYKDEVVNGTVQFTREADYNYNTEKLQLLSVETSRTSREITDNKLLVLNFNYPVNESHATDLYNYDLRGYTIKEAKVNSANPTQVYLMLDNTLTYPAEPYLYVWNIRAANSAHDMEVYYEKVYLNETVGPVFMSSDVTGPKEIKLTFNEALGNIESRSFTVTDSTNRVIGVEASIDPTDSRKVVLTLDENLIPSSTVTIRLLSGRVVQDVYNNASTFTTTTRTVPSTIPNAK